MARFLHMFLSSMMPDSDQSPRHRFQEKRSAEFCAAHLFDLTSDAIYVVDSEDRVTFWNAGAEALYGWRSDEVIGHSLLGVLKSSPSSTGEMREALRREGHWQGETIHTRRDGTPVDVSSRVCKKGDTHGGNGFVLRIDTDVTARKHAERERANFQSLFEATAGAYLVLQPKDYEIVAASDAYLHATSTNRGIIGRKLFEVFPDAPGDSTADGVRNLAASLKRVEANRCADAMDVQRYPIQVASAEGSTWEERFWNPLNSPVFSATGELVFIVHRVEDVTPFVLAKRGESKGAEAMRILLNRSSHMENEIVRRTQELLAVNERLREAEERFRLLANTIPQLTWMAKPDGWIFWFNQRWYEFTGKTPAEMEGWGWQSVHDPEELPRVMDCWRAALEMEEPWEDTFLLRRQDGELRWHLSRAMPFRDSNNRIVLWFGTNTDITDLVKAEEAARSANRAKDQFIAALSHELRTPLMPVLAVVSYLVKQTAALPRELRGEIEMIQRNVELEARLIDDLLDITRISSGKLELALEITDAHLAVRDAFEICAQDMRNKKLAVELDLKAVDSRVLADPVRLHQVFWNIVNNAVKFTPDNGRIVIRSHNNDRGEFVLEVEDSGIGFEADTLDYIFDAFEQGDRSITRQFGGLGLGLTIAKSLVDAHHGRLEAQSQGKDKGATFRLALNAVTKETEAQTSSCSPSAYSAPLRILVVEDHEDTRRVLANLLREKGHEVFTAANVATGLEILNRQSLDVLLSDIGLPDGNGYQLMERAKALQPLIGISLSGFGMAEDIARAFDAGFAHHLIKPVNFEQLESVLRRVSPRSLFSTASPQLHHGCHSAAATFLIPEPARLPRPADS